ncbi:ATP-grasp domain-containing protein [Methanobacterium sp. ACI-7]|uniref:ATP-grasp domain-containing protein n=1 Tax=unclassified Methanobacterium TaxID=2627676 RepID=UPI0039C34F85
MKNVLVVGTNTRPVACSAKKMGHKVFSVDYFCTHDLVKCSDYLRCILSQTPYESCGNYAEKYDPSLLQKYADEVVDDVDYILCSSGAVPENFPESKVVGNKKIMHIENKYNLYNLLKNKFNVPETFSVSSYDEADEIVKSEEDKNFLVKPIIGAGGKDIRRFEETTERFDFSRFMLQEVIEGESISASVLSTKDEAKTILTSRQIIGNSELGQLDEFAYCGNMVPYTDNPEIKKTAEDIIKELGLVGSNGIDMIESNGELYVIEANPRFQGTLECNEQVLGINMFDAHFKASNGTLIDIPEPKGYAVKMVVFAKWRSIAGNLEFEGVYDIPEKNVIIEKDEPAATVITGGPTLKDAIKNGQKIVNRVYDALIPYPLKVLVKNVSI